MANLSARNDHKGRNVDVSSVETVAGHLSEREELMLIEKINAPAKEISSSRGSAHHRKRQTVQEKKVMSLDDLANCKR
jgi:hypothetical protein